MPARPLLLSAGPRHLHGAGCVEPRNCGPWVAPTAAAAGRLVTQAVVVRVGFEPTYATRADLQSAAFNHSATSPVCLMRLHSFRVTRKTLPENRRQAIRIAAPFCQQGSHENAIRPRQKKGDSGPPPRHRPSPGQARRQRQTWPGGAETTVRRAFPVGSACRSCRACEPGKANCRALCHQRGGARR